MPDKKPRAYLSTKKRQLQLTSPISNSIIVSSNETANNDLHKISQSQKVLKRKGDVQGF